MNIPDVLVVEQLDALAASFQKLRGRFFVSLFALLESKQMIFLPAILLIAVLLRVPNLNKSLWFDELWSTHIELGSLNAVINTVLHDVHPPFYSIFMFCWITLFGDTELSIRLPPLILGIASIALAYLLALTISKSKKVALFTSVLLCVSPVHIWYSQEARLYSALLFLFLLSLYAFYKSYESPYRMRWLFIYAIPLLLAVFTHYYMVGYLIMLSMIALYRPGRFRPKILIINFLILATFILYLVSVYKFTGLPTEAGSTRAFTLSEFWMLFFNWFLFGNSLWPETVNPIITLIMILTQVAFFVIFLLGLVRISRRSSFLPDALLYLLSLPLSLLVLTLIGFTSLYVERSMFILLPFFFLVIANGAAFFEPRPIAALCGVTIFIISLTTLATFYSKGNQWTVYKPNPDWRSTAQYLDSEINKAQNEVLLFAATPAPELTYYDSRIVESDILHDPPHQKLELAKQLLGENNYIFKQLDAGMQKEFQSRRERIENARLWIYYAGTEETVLRTLSTYHTSSFYLVHNIYWSGNFEHLLDQVENDSRAQLLSTYSAKGIEVFKFTFPFTASSTLTAHSNSYARFIALRDSVVHISRRDPLRHLVYAHLGAQDKDADIGVTSSGLCI